MKGNFDTPGFLEKNREIFFGWLLFAVLSLSFAGVFAFLTAMTRTPVVQLLPSANYFQISLVTHVTFAFTVWILCFGAALWLYVPGRMDIEVHQPVALCGLCMSGLGSILMIGVALLAAGEPVLLNYFPVLDHPAFYVGMILFSLGIVITAVNYLWAVPLRRGFDLPVEAFGLAVSALITVVAFLAVFVSWGTLGTEKMGRLIWGPGHILQFANTLNMAVAWFLVVKWYLGGVEHGKLLKGVFSLYLLIAAPLPLVYFSSLDLDASFTLAMQFGIGVPSALVLLLSLKNFYDGSRLYGGFRGMPWREPAFGAYAVSMLLFIVGGVIASLIAGSDTRIPAHYHGAVGAVTTVFMGVTFALLPAVNRETYSRRWAVIQPYLYGLGLVGIAVGLYWAGLYGAPRKAFKTVMENQALFVAMNLMGAGSLVAIIGGADYVINAALSLLRTGPVETGEGEEGEG